MSGRLFNIAIPVEFIHSCALDFSHCAVNRSVITIQKLTLPQLAKWVG